MADVQAEAAAERAVRRLPFLLQKYSCPSQQRVREAYKIASLLCHRLVRTSPSFSHPAAAMLIPSPHPPPCCQDASADFFPLVREDIKPPPAREPICLDLEQGYESHERAAAQMLPMRASRPAHRGVRIAARILVGMLATFGLFSVVRPILSCRICPLLARSMPISILTVQLMEC